MCASSRALFADAVRQNNRKKATVGRWGKNLQRRSPTEREREWGKNNKKQFIISLDARRVGMGFRWFSGGSFSRSHRFCVLILGTCRALNLGRTGGDNGGKNNTCTKTSYRSDKRLVSVSVLGGTGPYWKDVGQKVAAQRGSVCNRTNNKKRKERKTVSRS